MKSKIYFALAFATLLALGGCKKEEGIVETVTFDAILADNGQKADGDAKLYLDDDDLPSWVVGDLIHVNNADGSVTSVATNKSRGQFTVDGCAIPSNGGKYFAVFPANIGHEDGIIEYTALNIATNGQKVHLPRVQIYDDYSGTEYSGTPQEGKQKIIAPMFAYNQEQPVLQFHNLCSMLEITVVNDKAWDMVLDSIQVEASAKILCGEMSIQDWTSATPYLQAATETVTEFEVEKRKNTHTVSLARGTSGTNSGLDKYLRSSSLGTNSALSSTTSTSATLYIYLPTTGETSNSNNIFTIRVFSHPVWKTNTGYSEDRESRISYEMKQTTSIQLQRNKLFPITLSLSGCNPTFTSLKPFSVGGSGTDPVCISRGNAQYYITQYNANYTGKCDGHWRFSPHQWEFLHTASLAHNDYGTSKWIEHFTWGSGEANTYTANNPTITGTPLCGPTHHFVLNQTGSGVDDRFTEWFDWGANFTNITYGSNSTWRTLTQPEIHYMLKTRNSVCNIAAGSSSNKNNFAWVELTDGLADGSGPSGHTNTLWGILIMPDNFIFNNPLDLYTRNALSIGTFKAYNNSTENTNDVATRHRNDNELTKAKLEYYEARGCIFLPCIGVFTRSGNPNDIWTEAQPEGTYWTSTPLGAILNNSAYVLMLSAEAPNGDADCYSSSFWGGDVSKNPLCSRKMSVRLVRKYNNNNGADYIYDPLQ